MSYNFWGGGFNNLCLGCYRQPFSCICALSFLAVAPPAIYLHLMAASTVDTDEGRLALCRLGNLSLLTGEMRHACAHARGCKSPISPSAAWRTLKVRRGRS
eukprot:4545888-Amphidinium_carterae.1